MHSSKFLAQARQHLAVGTSLVALLANLGAPTMSAAQEPAKHLATATPIQHVIVIIGENRTFDHVFATYKPVAGETVNNLLSEGIVKADGTPGPNFSQAAQFKAYDDSAMGYQNAPNNTEAYAKLPPVLAGGPTTPYLTSIYQAIHIETDLPKDYYVYMTTGGTGLTHGQVDTRIPHAASLPNGPFQITSATHPYDAYDNSPVHRFYQMWQDLDCSTKYATSSNPSGCINNLFPWVETSIGAGTNGLAQAAGFGLTTTKEGSTSMGFYNVQNGDASYFTYLANTYAMSDNFHQSVMGGTGANHIMLGTGDAIFFSQHGQATAPPENVLVAPGTPNAGIVNEIENPNPQPGTNNWYTEDGYGGGSYGSPSYGGGSYTNCADTTQPGVQPIVNYLQSLGTPIDPRCEADRYYLLNNYNPGYFGDGHDAYLAIGNPGETVFTIPPSTVPDIGDSMNAAGVSWAYYGGQWNQYLANPNANYVLPNNQYCNICNFFQYSTSIMTNPASRANMKDTLDLTTAIANNTLPAVSFVKPDGWLDGHPASSKLILLEGFVKKIVDEVQANPAVWNSTAIIVTFDEGGGYWDSGYVQPLDYFGDGTRIPTLVVSPFTKAGHISHSYADHVSILKFIEANWGLPPITGRSRDNFPNPVTSSSNPYVPLNSPAISDLMDVFDFSGSK
jgi:phospholipase C